MKWIPMRKQLNSLILLVMVINLMGILSACGANVAERAIVGKWISGGSDIVFEFFEDRTYHITNPNGLFEKEITGQYHSRGSGSSKDLSGAEFVLVNGFDIKFNPTGNAFFINIDGTRGDNLFYRVLQ